MINVWNQPKAEVGDRALMGLDPSHFKTDDAEIFRLGMALGSPTSVHIEFDEIGFWIEVPDEEHEAWADAICEFFKS